VTARGKPSGIATTTITTAKIKAEIQELIASSPLLRAQILIISAMKVAVAAPNPINPI